MLFSAASSTLLEPIVLSSKKRLHIGAYRALAMAAFAVSDERSIYKLLHDLACSIPVTLVSI